MTAGTRTGVVVTASVQRTRHVVPWSSVTRKTLVDSSTSCTVPTSRWSYPCQASAGVNATTASRQQSATAVLIESPPAQFAAGANVKSVTNTPAPRPPFVPASLNVPVKVCSAWSPEWIVTAHSIGSAPQLSQLSTRTV